MFEIACITTALIFGYGSKRLGFPPLIGYLISGSFIFANSDAFGLTAQKTSTIDSVAHIGVLLLLFTVGLKLDIKQVLKKEVVGTGLLHAAFSVMFYLPVIYYFFASSLLIAISVAVALSFSSTVGF